MYFSTMLDLKKWINAHKKDNFNGGSQGECFCIGNQVYKIFNQFMENEYDEMITYNKSDIMQFSTIVNNTYVWPIDTIVAGNVVVGYITSYVDAKELCNIDPLKINLDKFYNFLIKADDDIKIVSNNGVQTFDVMYNILYGKNGFKVIDSLDYSRTDIDGNSLYKKNRYKFYYGIKLFLVHGIFDDFIASNYNLTSMFNDADVSGIDFLKDLRKLLSDREGFDITKLGDAKKSIIIRKKDDFKYIRGCRRYS